MFNKRRLLVVLKKNNYPSIFKAFKRITKQLCIFLSVLMAITSIQ